MVENWEPAGIGKQPTPVAISVESEEQWRERRLPEPQAGAFRQGLTLSGLEGDSLDHRREGPSRGN